MPKIALTFYENLHFNALLEAISLEGSSNLFADMGLPTKIGLQPELIFSEARELIKECYNNSYDRAYVATKYSRFELENTQTFFDALDEFYDAETSQAFYYWALYNVITERELREELNIWGSFFHNVIKSILNCQPNLLEKILPEALLLEILRPLHSTNIILFSPKIRKYLPETNSEWEEWLVKMKQKSIGDFDPFTSYDLLENARALIYITINTNAIFKVFNKLNSVISNQQLEQLEQLVRAEYPEFTGLFIVPTIDTTKFITS